jgi:hypothetical protein
MNIFDTKFSMYSNLFWDKVNNTKPTSHVVTLSYVLQRIKSCKSQKLVSEIQNEKDKEKRDDLKKELPVICFSGVFKDHRHSNNLVEHSGLIVLDFDKVDNVKNKKNELIKNSFVISTFVSPSGNGVKAVVWIKDKTKHLEHYQSLLKEFTDADKSTKDVARACFDCCDEEILINKNPSPYSKILQASKIEFTERKEYESKSSDFQKIVKWLENKNEAFISGNRNNFIYMLSGACCRFGINQNEAEYLIDKEYLQKDNTFTKIEFSRALNSAYKKNIFGSAIFDNSILVSRESLQEIEIDLAEDIKDVIYGNEVYEDALSILRNGYESAEKCGINQIDEYYRFKRGEVTALTGIGNFGKSEFWNYVIINKSINDGSKWAVFAPESFPAHEYYHGLSETVLGNTCTPFNYDGTPNINVPNEKEFKEAYEWVSKHFFFIYPEVLSPTPEYIQSRFLELIIKEKVDGVIIDPFNQLANDYANKRDDQYLSTFLSDCSRFARNNNVYYTLIVHPTKMHEKLDGSYPEPGVFNIAGGAMWNNKLDNILVYHRPNYHVDKNDSTCTMTSLKIKRQKIVGKKGTAEFKYNRKSRRFDFNDAPINNFMINKYNEVEKTFDLEIQDSLKNIFGVGEIPF